MEFCAVCSQTQVNLVSVAATDISGIQWIHKLQLCVPEVDWGESRAICTACVDLLQSACAFRDLCLRTDAHRKRAAINNVKNECNCSANGPNTAHSFPFKCRQCHVDLRTRKHLTQHNRKVHPSAPPYNCLCCPAAFATIVQLHCHVKNHRDAPHQCHLCAEICNTSAALHTHLVIQHDAGAEGDTGRALLRTRLVGEHCADALQTARQVDEATVGEGELLVKGEEVVVKDEEPLKGVKQVKEEEPVICYHCNEGFAGKTVLIGHLREAHARERKEGVAVEKLGVAGKEEGTLRKRRGRRKAIPDVNPCEMCGMVFSTPYLLKRHLQNVHATEKKYKCDMCEQKFVSTVYLNAHKRYHSGKRPHICSFCGKSFITGSDLYHHEKIHKNMRAYKCEQCPKAFNTSSDLHKHKLCVHQDRSAWKHVCGYCARRFPQKNNLDAHVKTHTGEKNFPCHLCERRCVNKSVLMRHIRSHSNVRRFKCASCNAEYKYQKSLDIHLAKAHGIGDVRVPERVKKYYCHMCPKAYVANNKLQKHIRAHTGERPYACHVCDKRFIDKSYVRQHLKTSHSIIWPANTQYLLS